MGAQTGEMISDQFPTPSERIACTPAQLHRIEGIGNSTARKIESDLLPSPKERTGEVV
jgi:hypothetical protein